MSNALEDRNVVSLQSFFTVTLTEIDATFGRLQEVERGLEELRSLMRVRLAALQASTRLTDEELAQDFKDMQDHPERAQTAEAFIAGLRRRMDEAT